MSDQDTDQDQHPTSWQDVVGCAVMALFFLGLVALCGWLGVIGDR